MTQVDSSGRESSGRVGDGLSDEEDAHLLRLRRIGRQLFSTADCLVILQDMHAEVASSIPETTEYAFCRSLAASETPLVVHDVREHPTLRNHPAVLGRPRLRFFAAHPVRSHDGRVVGSVALVDYLPRPAFQGAERCMLADLVALVERELHLRKLSAVRIELEKKNKYLRRKSLIDPLIRTWNRGAIMRILGIEATRCDRAGHPLSLIVADLDHFKKINDRYGHPAGDAVLVKVADRLRNSMRAQDALGRYGGEEFLAVLPGASHETAMAVAERMRAAVMAEPAAIGDALLNLSISAGVASTDLFPTASTDELISRADMALYAAKDKGRNCVVNATPN